MAETDSTQKPVGADEQPVIVLVQPQMGENIGAAARAMLNFGLDRMRIVAPRDGWPNPRATAMASGAGRVLDAARCFDGTPGAIDDLHHVFATTARPRDFNKPVMTPETAMIAASEMSAQGRRVGFLFGPERAGLENDDLIAAHTLVSVPVNPAFGSLNLAQCVLLTAYEWSRARNFTLSPSFERDAPPATVGQIARFVDFLEDALDQKGFFWPEDKAESMRANLRDLFIRKPLSDAEVRILYGVVRHLGDVRQRQGASE